MKKLSFILIILSLTIIFSACPPLLEDDVVGIYGAVLTMEDPAFFDPDKTVDENLTLDVYKWFIILDKIAKDGKYVSLDLSKAICNPLNPGGGLIEVTVQDDADDVKYIAFDPFPASASGKDYIVSITLPTVAKMIKRAVDDETIDEDDLEETKKFSAFRAFTNLRSVKAENVTIIGNLAFADCTALTEVIFPKVGHTVTVGLLGEINDKDIPWINNRRDIGKYAFLGCTGLKEVKFNSAAVIGEYAFKDCTSLSKIDFPEVWRIEDNAFEGCTSLVNVFFEKASKIGEKAFKDCTGLKKAEFNVEPDRVLTSFAPLDPAVAPCVFDSVIFYPSVFTGCKALAVVNIRRAWNVYFSDDVFANVGTSIEINLYDEPKLPPGFCLGHPQNAYFLGTPGSKSVTLKTVDFFVPVNGEVVWEKADDENIANFAQTTYPTLFINLNRKNP